MLGAEGRTAENRHHRHRLRGSAIAMAAARAPRCARSCSVTEPRPFKAVAARTCATAPGRPGLDSRWRLCRPGRCGPRHHHCSIDEKAGGAADRGRSAGRLRLLDANVKVFQDIVPKLVKAAAEAVIIVADDTAAAGRRGRQLAGHDRIVDAGLLDSLRFACTSPSGWRSARTASRPRRGEHGTSSVSYWSSTRSAACRCASWRPPQDRVDTFRRTSSRTCASPTSPSSKASAPASTASA